MLGFARARASVAVVAVAFATIGGGLAAPMRAQAATAPTPAAPALASLTPGSPAAQAAIRSTLEPTPDAHIMPTDEIAGQIKRLAPAKGSGDLKYAAGGQVMVPGHDVVPIFWFPTTLQDGTVVANVANYQSTITQFLTDLGSTSYNQILTQYSQTINGVTSYIRNAAGAVTAIVDTTPYPAAGPACANVTGLNCVDDAQIQAEVTKIIHQHSFQPDFGTGYFVYTASGESQCLNSQNCSVAPGVFGPLKYCGYHSNFALDGGNAIYAMMPYTNTAACGMPPSWNGAIIDRAITTTEHEFAEMSTDPIPGGAGWRDASGFEIGDKCSGDYGATPYPYGSGFANLSLNGHLYLAQTEYDNVTHQCVTSSAAPLIVPDNDAFAQAKALHSYGESVHGFNSLATKQAGEPAHTNAGGASVWYSFTARSDQVVLDTCGSGFDTLLAVYTGTAVNLLTPIASNDDDNTCGNGTQSRVAFTAVPGQTYRVAVDGFNSGSGAATGNVVVNLRPQAPSNDNFASATVVPAGNSTLKGGNDVATRESGEPNHAGDPGGNSVWYRFTAASATPVQVDTCGSSFDTRLAIYTGTAVNALTPVASNDDGNCAAGTKASSITFTPIAGRTYRVAVDGTNSPNLGGATGAIVLHVLASANDAWAAARLMPSNEGSTTGNNSAATIEPLEPLPVPAHASKTVWYSFTPTTSNTMIIDTCGSTTPTVLTVYSGNTLAGLTRIGWDTTSCNGRSRLAVFVNAFENYFFQVDGTPGNSGPFNLRWSLGSQQSEFAFPAPLSGAFGAWTDTNAGASAEPGEPMILVNLPTHTLWYTYTPATSTTLEINTCGTGIDTLLAVYTGSAINALTPIAANDDSCGRQSRVKFDAIAGTTYRIQVDGYNNATGDILLTWRLGIQISIGDATVSEGDGGSVTATFPVRLSKATNVPVTATYDTFDGVDYDGEHAATAGSDYGKKTAQTLTIPAGATSGTIKVSVTGDRRPEPDESFHVVLSNPSGAIVNLGSGTGTILDNDGTAAPVASIGDASIVEGDLGTLGATLDVTLDHASDTTVTVPWTNAAGTATVGSDFVAKFGTLTFAPGVTSQTLTVVVKGDAALENDETVNVYLGNPTGATVGDDTGVITILNDDSVGGLPNAVSVGDATVIEGNGVTHNAVFPVRLVNPFLTQVQVQYTTTPGTATATTDYTPKTGTLTIAAGAFGGSIKVPVVADGITEANETFTVTITGVSPGASIGRAGGTGTIVDDDPTGTPVVSIGQATTVEGDAGTMLLTVPITLSQVSAVPVTVKVNSGPGSPDSADGNDYTAIVNKTITIPAGSLFSNVNVTLSSDLTYEFDETFTLTLSNALGATIGRAVGTDTILGDD